MKTIQGTLSATGRTFGIVISRFNSLVTTQLLNGAVDCLLRHGGTEDALTVVYVPGAFELPQAALQLAHSGRVDAIICLGCVIRGQTPHFDYIAGEVAKGIAQVSLSTGVPVTFGIVTADALEQAIDRAGAKTGNKGADAARAAIEMANLLAAIPK